MELDSKNCTGACWAQPEPGPQPVGRLYHGKEKEIRALLFLVRVLPIRPQHKKITNPVAPFVLPFRPQKVDNVASFDFFCFIIVD